jgi:hypothetical protein
VDSPEQYVQSSVVRLWSWFLWRGLSVDCNVVKQLEHDGCILNAKNKYYISV